MRLFFRTCVLAALSISWLLPAQSGAAKNDSARESTIAWLRDHAVDISVDGPASGSDSAAVAAMAGGARIIAFGEATHGTHEFLAVRNRIFQYLVGHAGVSTLALETGFREALPIDQFVSSGGQCEPTDAVVRAMMSWSDDARGPGRTENRELLRWLCDYNRAHAPARVHIYGFDLSGRAAGGGFPNAPAAVTTALEYVQKVDPSAADALHKRLGNALLSFRTLSYSQKDKDYDRLSPADRDTLTAVIAGLNALFRSHAAQWRAATSPAEFETSAHLAATARQLDGYFRANYRRGGMSGEAEVYRDRTMAENVAWILGQEGTGRVFVFAHDVHVARLTDRMGSFLSATLGHQLFVIATVDSIRRDASGRIIFSSQGDTAIGAVCSEIGKSAFVADLHQIPAGSLAKEWLSQPRLMNPISFGQTSPWPVHVLECCDALVFVREVNVPRQ